MAHKFFQAGIAYSLPLFLALSLLPAAYSQTKTSGRPRPKVSSLRAPSKPTSEPEAFNAAWTLRDPDTRIAALKAFISEFPASPNKNAAQEYLTAALSESASVKMQVGDVEGGVEQFREAVEAAPVPISEKLYTDTISKIVQSLYYHGEQDEALDIAESLEPKLQSQLPLLLSLGNFYVSVEDGAAAKRLALRAVEASPTSAEAYLMLAIAHRLQFELEQSAVAYAKAVELDPASVVARRGLADMYRALGRFSDSAANYREILAKDDANIPARTGLVLALFDSGEKAEAEKELDAALAANPSNVILLAGAAYWYAIHNQPDRAIDLAQKAIATEPRYVWSHVALARAYTAKNQPLDAEQALLRGRQYGRFPTLEYELAVSRAKAGFFREAIEALRGTFNVEGDKVVVKLGGRVERADSGFGELLAPERKASIFEPDTIDDPETAARLKALLAFDKELQEATINEDALNAATDKFVEGDDEMKVHRNVYAATALLEKKAALPKVVELARSAMAYTDKGLDAPNAGAAIMASELYESRMTALSKNEYLHVPDVPKPMLSAILRGRIEEIAGWALYQQGKTADAITRLRRAVSVMPDKSAWWRSSVWKLGAALQADGKDTEALEAYMKSYKADKPDGARYIVVEALYKKVRGSADGLESEIGANPMPVITAARPEPSKGASTAAPIATASTLKPEPRPQPSVSISPKRSAPPGIPSVVPVAEPVVEQKQQETKTAEEIKQASPASLPIEIGSPPAAKAELSPQPVVKTVSEPVSEPAVTATSSPLPEATPLATPSPAVTPAPIPEETPQKVPEPVMSPKVEQTPAPAIEIPVAVPSPTPSPAAETPVTLPLPTLASEPPVTVPSPTPSPEETRPMPSPSPERSSDPPKPPPEENKPKPEEIAKVDEQTVRPPGERAEPEPKSTNLAVVVTDNIPPPTTIKPPAKARPETPAVQKRSRLSAATNTPLFEPIIITVPKHDDAAAAEPAPLPRSCTVSVSQERISLAGGGGNIGLLVGTGDPADLKSLKYYSSSPKDVTVHAEARIAGTDDKAFFMIRSLSKNSGIYQVVFEAPCGKKQVVVNVR